MVGEGDLVEETYSTKAEDLMKRAFEKRDLGMSCKYFVSGGGR